MSVFPGPDDFEYTVKPPIPIESSGDWLVVGLGAHGLILQFSQDPSTLRWIGQVIKFCPMLTYIHEKTLEGLLYERGVPNGVQWQRY
ncbi:MAG: hypothetical protein ACK4NQ_02375 [Fimbriimonadaceae bacterium]